MGWLMRKVEKHVEEKLPGSAEAIEQIRSDASTGESHAFVLTPGHVTQVESQQAVQDHLAEQLARLGALHDRGALTDAEYEEQKRQITGTRSGE
jgi:Short C-terminal domain